jgi:hypothetical protein
VLRPVSASIAIASIVSLFATAAQAADGPCYLEVEGHVYLDKICNIERKFGTVSIGTGESSREQYFAYVEIAESPDRAVGYWNGRSADARAHVRLDEPLTRQGNCWSNKQAKICDGAR